MSSPTTIELTGRPEGRLEGLAERELVERAKHEPEAFGELYRRHRRAIFRFACARMGNVADAEDLTSEVFLRALLGIGRYQERGAPFGAWLHQIARNVTVDQRRQRRPADDIDQHPDLAADVRLEELVAGRDRVRRIGLAARRLPLHQREAFALRFGHDLGSGEMARRMGRSQGAVKLLLNRALHTVRAAEAGKTGRWLAS